LLKDNLPVRRFDDLGRIVIPKEIRRALNLTEGDPMEIGVNEKGQIVLDKYIPLNWRLEEDA